MTETNHITVVTAAGERRDGRATGRALPGRGEDHGHPARGAGAGHGRAPIRPRSMVLAVPVTAGATAV
ncbi:MULTISPECIES: hypothetical protein [unclassified Streptomyces]|uniref:hypothetical protein n=1 Tax=unclassified Streptomyces TaxID=2593676 RepID=UPI00037B80E1|nr:MULTISPECIES: hypothetical protein [unclassified Streptomyces]MYX38691.1 hypothetical protein [Streptomyces sp. SID8377]